MFDPTFSRMAATSDRSPTRWRRLVIRWLDRTDTGWTVPTLLLSFLVVWTAYLMVAYLGTSLHPDTLETWTLGRHFEWGNPKHPPLMGWVARLWTEVFPLTDWSMQLMAMVNAAIGLWAVDLITRRFTSGDKRILVLLLLMLTPAYQFHAQRFNANAVLLSVWPWATYCFLRSFQSRSAGWAIAAGVVTALAMLGKYYSVFLIASFVAAAVLHPARRAYFFSPAPWISAVSGLLALGPHLYWLVETGAPTFDHARAHTGADLQTSLRDVLNFLFGIGAAISVAALTWLLTVGRRLGQAVADFARMEDGLKLLLLTGIGTLVFPILTCFAIGADLPSLWAFQGLFLFVVPVVASIRFPIERFYTVNTLVLVSVVALVALSVAAPVHALYRNQNGYEEGRNFYRQAALELTRKWHENSEMPLTAVSGDDALAFATAFYSPDHPHYARPFAYQYTWRLPRKTTLDNGWAALCFEDQKDCAEWMRTTAERAGHSVLHRFEVQASLFGRPGVKRTMVALLVYPHPPTIPDELSAIKRPPAP